jgi:SAM-dependent methyltransferase
MSSPVYACRLCGGRAATAFAAREMTYGTRETFQYFQCRDCDCVQIAQVPADLGRFYPSDYYSLEAPARSWRKRLKVPVFRSLIVAGRLLPSLAGALKRVNQRLYLFLLYDATTRGNRDARLLDVGSGAGRLLEDLVDVGYRNVLGIDRFITQDREYRDRLLVRQTDIFGIGGRYDVISFHHSLEHMPDQPAVLARARELLSDDGCVIVRLPIIGGEAWELYREDWIQLDPPRHLYLHSLQSLRALAAACGLRIADLDYDSTAFQFWGSELGRRDIPVYDPRSPAVSKTGSVFTAAEMAAFERRARAANQAQRGDQIAVRLVKAD